MKTITVPTRYGTTETVKGIELKRFFVHRTLSNGAPIYKWTVTHKATGRAMPRRFRTRSLALQVARRLDPIAAFDDLPVNPPKEGFAAGEFAELIAITRNIYSELGV